MFLIHKNLFVLSHASDIVRYNKSPDALSTEHMHMTEINYENLINEDF